MSDKADIQENYLRKNLPNRWWRLSNLYYVLDENQKKVLFKPRPAQRKLLEEVHFRNIILKARQMGFTTFIQILFLDHILFNENSSALVVAHNKDDAEKIFRKKVKYAYENLHPLIRESRSISRETADTIILSNGSEMSVATSGRSGTYNLLHISEHGKLCAKYPDKAQEVKTGTLPAVHKDGLVFIESTAEGNHGDFYDMSIKALQKEATGEPLTYLDYKMHFFPWHKDQKNRLDAEVPISSTMQKYFDDLEFKKGIKLNRKQKAWYVKTEEVLQDDMKREHPSFPEEAFEAAVEGTYFHRQMMSLRKQRRLTKVPYDPSREVYTFWDLGRDCTSIWFMQEDYAGNFKFFDYYENHSEEMGFYINELRGRGYDEFGIAYNYGICYLPHDGVRKNLIVAKSPQDVLEEHGFRTALVARTNDKQNSINAARRMLPMCMFDAERCSEGIEGLDNYRKERDKVTGGWKDKPRHDQHSHRADSFQTFALEFHDRKVEEELEDYRARNVPNQTRNTVTGY